MFDDEMLGGIITTQDDGAPVLSLNSCSGTLKLALPWECKDILPELPQLRKSAETG